MVPHPFTSPLTLPALSTHLLTPPHPGYAPMRLSIFGDKDWLVGFEFAHLSIFFMALITIFQGLYFMVSLLL